MTPNLHTMHSQRLFHKGDCLKAKHTLQECCCSCKLTAGKVRKVKGNDRSLIGIENEWNSKKKSSMIKQSAVQEVEL